MNNYAIIKMKNPEQALELNDLLKSKYKIENETFSNSGSFIVELNDINDTTKPIILALVKFSRTKNFNRYISVVKSQNFEELLKFKEKLN
ncbi:hypothetical protein NZD88_20980 [Chryseobacterium antibioticum]|uniref:Uncharacterized protein n=1 Tax=Chryseobacterium pyrolae TaxID=2987481 RepID=A0ABT2IMY7_9FLAO|nr:hypothetical protein [Chryseobacterium pyrolae]MCT2410038.1 hypothetical protein [Chryseobacterium pyrolae]